VKIIDRVVEAFSPMSAIRRQAAREFLNTHRGGLTTRIDKSSTESRSLLGGNAAKRANQRERRNRARRVYAEHPIGRTLLKTEVDNVISCGFTLQAKALNADGTPAEAFNEEVEERWCEWLEIADIRQMRGATDLIREAYRNPRCDGDGGIVLVSLPGGRSRLQYVPGDLICNPNTTLSGPKLIDGIEVDAACRPLAFHVKTENEWGKLAWERVSADDFIYLAPDMDDAMGLRGDSCYSQIFPLLDQFDGYVEAVTIAARMAAIFGLIFKTDSGPSQFERLGVATNSQGNDQRAMTVENGIARYIGSKDDVVQVNPQQPMQQTPDFIRALCRLMGAPFDMPLELVCKDLSQVNFSSARIGLIGYYRACRVRQKSFKSRCMSRTYRWWLSREIKMGRILAPIPAEPLRHEFVSEGWDYTDPVTDAQADHLLIDMGIKTRRIAAAERGMDYDELRAEELADLTIRKAQDLTITHSSMTRDSIEIQPKPTATTPADEQGAENDAE
jgi:lambda family phage portal protein